jgi:hypothetical protein
MNSLLILADRERKTDEVTGRIFKAQLDADMIRATHLARKTVMVQPW